MNKEYDKNNQGALWKADKLDKKGNEYYNGNITIDNKEYGITMFPNESDNPKAPMFRIKVNMGQAPKEEVKEEVKEDVFAEFGASIEISEDSLPF